MKLLTSAALLAMASASAPAEAQMVRAQDPQSLVRAMKAHGYAAELSADKTGDPMIRSTLSGTNYQILFYNCTDHKECATVQFHVGYDLKTGPSLESINEWNRTQRFGHAHLDKENDPILEMDVDLDDGGLNEMLFIDNIEFWTNALNRFEKHIGFRT
jgi:hypothetical protein